MGSSWVPDSVTQTSLKAYAGSKGQDASYGPARLQEKGYGTEKGRVEPETNIN